MVAKEAGQLYVLMLGVYVCAQENLNFDLELPSWDVSCLFISRVQEAEVGNSSVPEPFDVRTEHAVEAKVLNFDEAAEVGTELGVPNGK